jgi:hypothetical protein
VLALDSYRAWRNGAATRNYKPILHMKIVAFILCWALILTAPGVMAQQTAAPSQSWDVLRQFQGGEKLEVEKKTGKKKLSGRFVSLSDADLIIARKGKTESFSRDEVKNIWRVVPQGRAKRVIGDMCRGAGFTSGFIAFIGVVGLGLRECDGGCADEGVGIVAALAGISVAGFLADRAMRKGARILIYSAP